MVIAPARPGPRTSLNCLTTKLRQQLTSFGHSSHQIASSELRLQQVVAA
ncbi:hypothetical protein [Methylobacterium sp. PvR107]|nr:hypothetical protein [Methylobacterium sp. PvR107]MBP1179400.1 hypothetical protein [Methylobacterium sp. PvR107]